MYRSQWAMLSRDPLILQRKLGSGFRCHIKGCVDNEEVSKKDSCGLNAIRLSKRKQDIWYTRKSIVVEEFAHYSI